jgi:hypothetical protein
MFSGLIKNLTACGSSNEKSDKLSARVMENNNLKNPEIISNFHQRYNDSKQ